MSQIPAPEVNCINTPLNRSSGSLIVLSPVLGQMGVKRDCITVTGKYGKHVPC